MKVIVLGCVHEQHHYVSDWMAENVPKADLIIVTGDVANSRTPSLNEHPMLDFLDWVNGWGLPVLFVPGNHDTSIESGLVDPSEFKNVIPLIHKEISLGGTKFFGSPYTPSFGHGWSYNVDRRKIDKYWGEIPLDTGVLITHGPPMHILDATEDHVGLVKHVGCKSLLNRVKEVKPKFHMFSHLHDEGGALNNGTKTIGELPTVFVNCSIVNLRHDPINVPKLIEI